MLDQSGHGSGQEFPVDEPFRLIRLLGSGGFAHTYLARVVDQALVREFGREEVALKIPLDRRKQLALKREIEINAPFHLRLKQIGSRNLVSYLGFDVFRGQIVMVMEYVTGGSLRQRIGDIPRQAGAPNPPVPVDEAVEIAMGILTGLSVIHQAKILHRDMKPENILLDDRTPKIADFGISRILSSNELASTTTGTVPYMSPELLDGRGCSYPTDVWSVGVTVYEMLVGRLPFGSCDTAYGALLDLIRDADPTPPSRLADVPVGVERVVLRALEKDPSRRYANASEMLQALAQFQQRSDEPSGEEIARVRAMLESGGGLDAVEAELRALVDRFPDSARGYQLLGELHNRRQAYSEAIKAFQAGIERDPDDGLLHWSLALAYQKRGRRTEAGDALERAIEAGLEESLKRHAMRLLRLLKGAG